MSLGTGAGRVLAPLLGSLRRRRWLRARTVTALSGVRRGVACVLTLRAPRGRGSPRTLFPLQDTTPDELLSAVLTAVLQDVKLSPAQLGDICVGELSTQALRWVLFPLPILPKPSSNTSPPPRHFPGVFTEKNVYGPSS